MCRVSGRPLRRAWCRGDKPGLSLCHRGRAASPDRGATMSGVTVDPAAAHLHASATVVDTHNDLLMLVSRRPPADQAAYFRDHWLPQLQAGGVQVQVLPVFIDDDFRPEGALRQTLRMVEAAHRGAAEAADGGAPGPPRADGREGPAPGRGAPVVA